MEKVSHEDWLEYRGGDKKVLAEYKNTTEIVCCPSLPSRNNSAILDQTIDQLQKVKNEPACFLPY